MEKVSKVKNLDIRKKTIAMAATSTENVARSIGGDDIEIRYLEKHEKGNVKSK